MAKVDAQLLERMEKLKLLVPEGNVLSNSESLNAAEILLSYFGHACLEKILSKWGVNCRRGSGGRGFISGAGETELQLQRRRFISMILISYVNIYISVSSFNGPLTASGCFFVLMKQTY